MAKVKFWICFFCCSFVSLSYGQDQYSYSGFESPVSVAHYGGYFYLSNAGKTYDLTLKDGDGYISRIKSDGSQQDATMKYITGLNSPTGIAAIQGTLYICDVDRLKGFDMKSGKKVFELSFEKENTMRLTDIVQNDDKTVYVSATDIHTIFEVNLSSKKYKKWVTTPAPMGLLVNENRMYVSSWGTGDQADGKLGVIDMKNKKYRQLTDIEGHFWGLAISGSRLYFSDWMGVNQRGIIRWLDLQNESSGRINLSSRINGPADFYYDTRNNLFIIPAALEGVVYGAMGYK